MSHLAGLRNVCMTYGVHPLFTDISLDVHERERVGVIGANGAGKSTLLKLLARTERPDRGEVVHKRALRMAVVPQTSDFPPDRTVEDIVRASLDAAPMDDSAHDPHEQEVERDVQIASTLTRLGFLDVRQTVGTLSGGWLKRVALATALVHNPELLLLDEPTNHLDLDGILWLEQWLRAAPLACMLVTHDRAFLEAVCTRIIEVNRAYPDGLLACEGTYSRFIEFRAAYHELRERAMEALENKVRHEVEWLKHGPKARTSKSAHRMEQARLLIAEQADVKARSREASADIDFSATGRATRRLIVATGLSMRRGDRLLFDKLDMLLKPGTRLGLVGPNGSGKTTLLKILAGQMQADAGEVRRATNLRIACFEQHRESLNPEETLAQALCPNGDCVVFKGREVHVAGWARRFGFDNRQLETPVRLLSGGEQAKVHIARLMLQPADVLLLDEPTNDLDLPTLELLEQNLSEFPGAIVLVTHDRYMLDHLSTVMLGLDGQGGHALIADYSQWAHHLDQRKQTDADIQSRKAVKSRDVKPKARLSYLEQREYAGLEALITEAESEAEALRTQVADPAVACDSVELGARYARLQDAEARIDALYARWEELEGKLTEPAAGVVSE